MATAIVGSTRRAPRRALCWFQRAAEWSRQRELSTAAGPAAGDAERSAGQERHRVVFLGTPQVSALVLQELLRASVEPGSAFEVAAVVSRPSSRHWLERTQEAGPGPGSAAPSSSSSSSSSSPPAGRPNWSRHSASAVERLARDAGLPPDRILCPVSPREPAFLDAMRSLRPALAVTAAYGAMLPQAFLDIPRRGTLNIHPSLLPKYRGAAPVQRCLADGCFASGVSLAFTVLACDAGPVLEAQQVPVPPDVQAPELTQQLFALGARMLLRRLPGVLAGADSAATARPQDEAEATFAPKILRQEAYLDFRRPAAAVHDHVRAMAGWPGARATLLLEARGTGTRDPIELKVLRTRVVPGPGPGPGGAPSGASSGAASAAATGPASVAGGAGGVHGGGAGGSLYGSGAACVGPQVVARGEELLVPCGDGNMLQILEVGRKPGGGGSFALTAREFVAGLSKRRLFLPYRL
ncbi:hypothetical protein HYH03_015673 [Edaphochlamys debaryana]|uniref:methionyl-tRNA formyltransferase n=1 Tax=Edaphochlamys debaryana TaxID=47281 RepID=A0A835XLG8_9CHLO|nr:hypothetical protein HYH03_015673 [Edaphochlamys debaryana]|eukprot:KAG2485610.1 hypothetical protein HYH03_015673 [Edaphochlamys debaryana]